MGIKVHEQAQAPEQSPAKQIVAAARATVTVTDALGREIVVRKLSPFDRMLMSKAAGDSATNTPYMLYALVAASTVSIDGVPMTTAQNQLHLEAAIKRLGDEGYDAALEAVVSFYGSDATEATAEAAKK